MKVKIEGKTIEVPDAIAKTNASLSGALAALGYQVAGMDIKRDKSSGVITFAVKPPPKPTRPTEPEWKVRERKEKERKAAIMKWLLPACNEAARLLVKKVEAGTKFSEASVVDLVSDVLLNAEELYSYEEQLAFRRGWIQKTKRGGVLRAEHAEVERRLRGFTFAQLVGFWFEAKFWNGFYDYNATLNKDSIALLKQYGIDFEKVARPFKEAAGILPEKKKARAAAA